MRRTVAHCLLPGFALVLLVGCAAAPTQAPGPQEPAVRTLADLRARGAVRLSADEVRAATVGTRAQTQNGSAWTHDPDGSLSMLSRQRDFSGLLSFSGKGTWRVRPDGAYCVEIYWQIHASSSREAWCVDLYTLDGVSWAVPSRRRDRGDDTLPARPVRSYRPIAQEPVRP